MTHLITTTEFSALARPVSIHLDTDEINKFIDECENVYIIPAIGYDHFNAIMESDPFVDMDADFDVRILLNGGAFSRSACGCNDTTLDYCVGLKKTLSYFVYARMGRADGSIVARSGYMRHRDQYGDHVPTDKKQYDDVMTTAEQYLASCVRYLQAHALTCGSIKPVRGTRATIKAIGD